MSDDRAEAESYDPPTIDDRVPISLPLIGQLSGGGGSAAFRPL